MYTLEPLLYGNLISQSLAGVDSFYLFDALGSTRQLAGSTASVTDNYLYDSFGNSLSATGTTTNCFRYVGRLGYYYDLDTTKLYLRARPYDSIPGRFTRRDPLGSDGGDINLYLYVRNRPAILTDPSGAICAPPDCSGGCIAGQAPKLKSCNITKLETLPESDFSCRLVTPAKICDKLKEYIDQGNKKFPNDPWVIDKCTDKDKCKCKDYSLKDQPLTLNLKDQLVVAEGVILGVGKVHCAFKVTGTVVLLSGALVFVECEKK